MDISVAIPIAYLLAAGSRYTGTPGDTNWLTMLAYFNLSQMVWANEPGGDWNSLYNPQVAVGVVTATNTFAMPDGVLRPSNKAHDYIFVICTDGTIKKFKTVPGPQLKYYSQRKGFVAVIGGSQAGQGPGWQLVFSQAFATTDQEYGGQLYLPAYMSPPTLKGIKGLVSVDNPAWLMYYSAQEWAQVDVTLVQNVPSLIAKATDQMNSMKLNNQATVTISQQTAPEGAAQGDTMGLGYG